MIIIINKQLARELCNDDDVYKKKLFCKCKQQICLPCFYFKKEKKNERNSWSVLIIVTINFK